MFNVNSSFYKFLMALQAKLHAEFNLEALSPSACLLHADGMPDIVYYLCGAGERIAVDSTARCIHIDEDRGIKQPDLLLNRIAALAGLAQRIHARDTVVARIDKQMAMAFQEDHHLQVALPGKYRFGLFREGELVAVAVFSGGRKMDNKAADYRSYELLRFCHKQGMQVVGGFSKLIDAFQQAFDPGDIMTYADKDWTDGSSYRKTGFAIAGETSPQVFWVDTRTMQRYYEQALPVEIQQKPAEERRNRGFVPVYNSGSIKLVKAYKHA
ncbi:hypothetical protein SAMN05660226_02484 [Parapedobacter luteus]|uniref:Uncharacterized protein n=2 Tax=Sphingobacteriaceae TaxID=84566 RepID=A0A1T5CZD0_9SPHI|nr:hypothetical protein SAMN05660226_02484 [Parapedobacter luteus]